MSRTVWLIVLVECALMALLGVAWLATHGAAWEWFREDSSLYGSQPPGGQLLPELDGVTGITPRVASRGQLRGHPAMLVGTCVDCRSGDVMGAALARLRVNQLPPDARVLVIAWGGDAMAWQRRYALPERISVHEVQQSAAAGVRRSLHLGQSGAAFLYGPDGQWRSTFHLGQVDPADMTHDLQMLGRAT